MEKWTEQLNNQANTIESNSKNSEESVEKGEIMELNTRQLAMDIVSKIQSITKEQQGQGRYIPRTNGDQAEFLTNKNLPFKSCYSNERTALAFAATFLSHFDFISLNDSNRKVFFVFGNKYKSDSEPSHSGFGGYSPGAINTNELSFFEIDSDEAIKAITDYKNYNPGIGDGERKNIFKEPAEKATTHIQKITTISKKEYVELHEKLMQKIEEKFSQYFK